jgi:putative ATP-dependent endonuclease of the OLD family
MQGSSMLLRRVSIENFRGLSKIEVLLDKTTVLIGENNSGKTSFLDALRLPLTRTISRKGSPFDEYDYHLSSHDAAPGDSGSLSITLDFAEEIPEEWSAGILQAIPDIVVIDNADLHHVILQVVSNYEQGIGDFITDFQFLDADGNALGVKTKHPKILGQLQQLTPLFYLSALRDAAREFSSRSSFWSPFLKNLSISGEMREKLEGELNALNDQILEAHRPLHDVKDHLEKAQQVVAICPSDTVSLEALPGRLFDVLAKTQVNIATVDGATLPLGRHGAGTQSLSVIFLFEAFLNSMLADTYDPLSTPILALEEPEAHLHPCAVRSLAGTLEKMKGQKVITTHSGDLLAEVPLTSIRRFCRKSGRIAVRQIQKNTLSAKDERLLNYHLRSMRGELFFARCWLLAEGPTEFWVFTEVARMMEIDLDRSGVMVIAYSNAGGPGPFIKIGNDLGIEWHVVADGDRAGEDYSKATTTHLGGRSESEHLTRLPTSCIETFLCENGFGSIFEGHIAPQRRPNLTTSPGGANYWEQVIACRDKTPKEDVILEVLEEMGRRGRTSVPRLLHDVINATLLLAER